MIKIRRYFAILSILSLVLLNGCEYKKSVMNTNWQISDISFLEIDGDKSYIYNIDGDSIYKVKQDDDILNYEYNSHGVLIKSVYLGHGKNLINNYLKIDNKNKSYEIKDYYCFTDAKLSPFGDKIAVRAYEKDDIFSALGLIFFNSKGESIEFNSDVSVSGDVYNFFNEDIVLYYGPSHDKQFKYGTIYAYDFIKKVEYVYYTDLDGFLIKFSIDKEGFLFLNERIGFFDYISFFNPKTSKKVEYDERYENIYSIQSIGDGKFIFAANSVQKKYIDLYILDCNEGKLEKILDGEESKFTMVNNLEFKDNEIFFTGKRDNSESNYIFRLNFKKLNLDNIYKTDNIIILNKTSSK